MLLGVIFLMFAIAAILGYESIVLLKAADEFKNKSVAFAVSDVSTNVAQYYKEFKTYPPDIASLATSQGYTHLRNWVPKQDTATGGLWAWGKSPVFYGRSGLIQDPTFFDYYRVVVSSRERLSDTDADYNVQDSNTCQPATAPYLVENSSSWCAPFGVQAFKAESKENASNELLEERVVRTRTLEKFVAVFNKTGAFTSPSGEDCAGAGPISCTLYSLVGATATDSKHCSGNWTWNGVPIGCEDLFNSWGQKVSLVFINTSRIMLVSPTTLTANGGAAVKISTEMEI